MSGFPATQDPSTLNTLAAGVFPSVAEGVRDLVKKEIPMFYILDKMGMEKVGEWGARHIVRVIDTDDSQPTSFTGLDPLSKGTVQGARAAIFPFANYDINVTIPWEDELVLSGPEALGDYVEEVTFKQCRALGGRMSDDLIHGNNSNSKNFLGLEQAVVTCADSGSPLTLDRYGFRQAANSYGGITRVAWTSTVPGSLWENNSVDFMSLSANPETRFQQTTALQVSEALKLMTRFLNVMTYEGTSPDILLSSWLPQEDMGNASYGLQRIEQGEKGEGFDLGISTSRFKGMTWYASNKFQHSGTAPTGGTSPGATTLDMIYVLTSSSWKYLVHKRANWANVPFLGLTDQAGAIGRIRHRAQLVCEEPSLNGSMYNYNGA